MIYKEDKSLPPIAILVPGILWIFEHVVAPIAAEHLPTLTSKLGSLAMGSTAQDIISTIEGVLGKTADEKTIELKGKISELLAQAEIDKVEAASASLFVAGARPFLFWGLSVMLLYHLALSSLIDTLNSLIGLHLSQIAPMDQLTMTLLTSLIGIGVLSRTAEKIRGVARNSMDD